MARPLLRTFRIPALAAAGASLLVAGAAAADWPQWRGPSLRGTSPERGLATRWTVSENVSLKVALPSGGASTPIILGDRVFLNVAEGDSVSLWMVDRRSGQVAWKRALGSNVGHAHRKHNMATPSPVTDGRHVFALTGAGILKGFDLEGRELWARDIQKEYGTFGLNWGYGSSPLLFEGALYVPVLHGMKTDDPSYLLGVDAASGKTNFRVERPTNARAESPDAYTTPAVVRKGDKAEVVVTGGDVVTGHDPKTGQELWRAHGLNPTSDPYYRIVASPVASGDIVVAPTRVRPMLVLRGFGRGDVSKSHLLWTFDQGPDVPTPATDGTLLYVVNDKGLLSCLDLATGKVHYGPQRLRVGTYSSSPLLADGKLYVTSEDGLTSVVKAGTTFELLAENALDDFTLASPAAAGGQLFLRTRGFLYGIGAPR
ncbi:MAG TPA: PQQ-binding-like beta-propeller repeat protein [Vicinamibacteria bacterium]|nr:PQQ-binding-like beta-propeller repeat protein [Vicinamibacteria bacterium]